MPYNLRLLRKTRTQHTKKFQLLHLTRTIILIHTTHKSTISQPMQREGTSIRHQTTSGPESEILHLFQPNQKQY